MQMNLSQNKDLTRRLFDSWSGFQEENENSIYRPKWSFELISSPIGRIYKGKLTCATIFYQEKERMKLLTQINHRYGGYAREAYTAFVAATKAKVNHTEKFVLFGRGRTGSTLLSDLLNSSIEVACDKEIFNRPVSNPWQFLDNRECVFSNPIYGFKLLSYQLRNFIKPSDPNDFMKYLTEDLGYKVIFLSRSNLLRQTLSKQYSIHRNAWHDKSTTGDHSKMLVDVRSLIYNLQEGRVLDFYEEEALAGIDHITVTYEDDLKESEAQQLTIARVRDYLGIKGFEAKTNLRKITAPNLEDFIENADELRRALKGTYFHDMIWLPIFWQKPVMRVKPSRKEYKGDDVTFIWQAHKCIHSERCWRNLPEVFKYGQRPWVDPNGAPAEKIKAQIETCPSGALTYEGQTQGEYMDQGPLSAKLMENGPIVVNGVIKFTHADGSSTIETNPVLCRCGQSGNKPFCDGSHKKAGFVG